MSRWKYKNDRVVVGDNSLSVRALNHGERQELTKLSGKVKESAGAIDAQDVQAFVVAAGSVDPKLTIEDIKEMPPDLADAASAKILELTGLSGKKAEPTTS